MSGEDLDAMARIIGGMYARGPMPDPDEADHVDPDPVRPMNDTTDDEHFPEEEPYGWEGAR